MLRRQQEYKEREMIHQERERERDERETQRRVEAELAQRNFERDRMEQLRNAHQARNHYAGRSLDDSTQLFTAQHLINAIITENIRPSDSRERYVSVLLILSNLKIIKL